ncbi:MAG: 50S ribosomal protein L9 [Myxococcales bacterium]|nr:50S ribosomal protein L9 [Myxococcales bacterium]
MKVVLSEDVETLGTSGDVVRVRPGYARNFLIPRGLAVPATESNLARVGDLKRAAAARAEKERAAAEEVAKKVGGVSVKIARAVGDENKMYGSVTTRDIEEAFAKAGVEIDRKKLVLAEPIKTLGLHDVALKLHPKVSVQLKVEVIKEGA